MYIENIVAASGTGVTSLNSLTGAVTLTQGSNITITPVGQNIQIAVTGVIPLAQGGTGVDLSTTGGTTQFLAQDASHVISARSLVAADVPNLPASIITTGTLALARGGTNADLSASGSATAFLAQDGSHVVTARSLVAADYVTMVGDSGSGGVKGAVPAPAAGDAAGGKFLKADGTWAVPAGGGGGNFANAEVPTGAIDGINQTYVLAHTPINSSLRFYWNGVYQVVGGSPPATITLATATVTCTTFTPQLGDSVVAFYQY